MIKTQRWKTIWLRWWLAAVMMGLIFIFSSTPSDDIPGFGKFDFSVKKLAHMLGYLLLARAYLRGIGKTQPKAKCWAWLLALLYAVTDEFHQSFVPGRHARWMDVGIDSLGALLGLLPEVLSNLYKKIISNKKTRWSADS